MICRKCKKEIPTGSAFCNHCGTKQDPKISHTKRVNGTGCVYKNGSNWRIDITLGYDSNGKRIRKTRSGFPTKKEALEYVQILKNQPTAKTHNLEHYYASWLKTDAPNLSSSKQTAYKIAWNKLEPIHFMEVSKLTILMLRDLISEVAPTYYPARDCKTLLSHLFKLAIADQLLSVNLSEYITLPKLNETERTPWNTDEIKTIWTAFEQDDSDMAAYLLLMIYTGMMPGELFNCRKECIHLDKLQIIGAGLKTDIRKQTPITIPTFLIPVIEKILTITDEDHPKLVCRNRDMFYEDYHKFQKKYGLRELPLYSCRHTTATALATGTVVIAPSTIQKAMRHSKFSTTQRYIHPDTSDVAAALENLHP